jgi:protein-S-isoprenylcysteine O-methyltransferase Ste14
MKRLLRKLNRIIFMSPLLKSLILFLLVALTGFIALPWFVLFVSDGFLNFQIGFLRFLGLLPLMFGLVLAFWVLLSFALFGKGTPAPFDPPKRLVVTGPFRYVRNPMYWGAVLVIVGEGLVFQSIALFFLAILLWVFFHAFVIYYEEPTLKKEFGQEYESYLKTVPRWAPNIFKK